jgi:hypothetical protein
MIILALLAKDESKEALLAKLIFYGIGFVVVVILGVVTYIKENRF